MVRTVLGIVAFLLIGGSIAVIAGGGSATPAPQTLGSGRYQLVTEGVFARDTSPLVLKLDTMTGDVWILDDDCDENGNRTGMIFRLIREAQSESGSAAAKKNP